MSFKKMTNSKVFLVFTSLLTISFLQSAQTLNGLPTFPPEVLNELVKGKSLINGTLTEEQITQVENSPLKFMTACHSKIMDGLNPTAVCDSAYKYLSDKCARLDFVLDYCLTIGKGTLTGYLIDRLDQLLNLHSKPSLSKIYHNWWLSRDNPNCNVVSGIITCP